MKKEELKSLVTGYGDAEIMYRSLNSRKLKYNVCTLDFDNKHIQSKRNRAKETPDTLLMYCWDTDSYRLMNPSNVTSVKPMSAILKNESA